VSPAAPPKSVTRRKEKKKNQAVFPALFSGHHEGQQAGAAARRSRVEVHVGPRLVEAKKGRSTFGTAPRQGGPPRRFVARFLAWALAVGRGRRVAKVQGGGQAARVGF